MWAMAKDIGRLPMANVEESDGLVGRGVKVLLLSCVGLDGLCIWVFLSKAGLI